MDWLRVLAVLLLVPFHSAIVFNLSPNSIVYFKDVVESEILVEFVDFIHLWHMPLLFFLTGGAVYFSLQSRDAGQFLTERVRRLLIPLLFGIAVFIPLMIYVRFIGKPAAPSFFSHYIGFFSKVTDLIGLDGHFTPGHLWFILELFCFSVITLPLLMWLKKKPNLMTGIGKFFSKPGLLLLFFILLTLINDLDLFGDKNPLYYCTIFLCGFLFIGDSRVMNSIGRQIYVYLIIGILSYGSFFVFRVPDVIAGPIYNLSRWSWMLFFLGLGHRLLNRATPALKYLGASSYTFYIVHLPVVTLVSWFIVKLKMPIAVKYSAIVILGTAVSFLLYELFKRIPPFRFLFGMKPPKTAG